MRSASFVMLVCFAGGLTFGQTAAGIPEFEFADVHVSPPANTPFVAVRTGPVRDGRYDVKTATMVNLISMAWGFTQDKVFGGPNWLELDRFDLSAKVPPGTTPEIQKLMLQALLAQRFRLVAHEEKKPLPAWALVAGKKPQLKEAAGTGEPGCKVDAPSARVEGGSTIRMGEAVAASMGLPATLNLGPGGTLQFNCRNITMAAFVERLRAMPGGTNLGPNPILDETGLKGNWNFDIRWSFATLPGSSVSEHVTVSDAIEKQLGLRLEERQVPTSVIVVDSVNRTPSANPPGTAEALPPARIPTEFEVASIKPADAGGRGGNFRLMPGGRLTAQNMPLSFLVNRAFTIDISARVSGLPAFADTERFDVEAKSAALAPFGPADMEAVVPALRALLADRFKMTWHTEDQQVTAYSLVPAKPKMKKADPASRIACKNLPPPPGSPPGTNVLSCQNISMALLAERLRPYVAGLGAGGVLDATGLEGGWDFTLTWGGMNGGGRGGPDAGPGDAPAASDPGGGLNIFKAIERQLGLKLEKGKRSVPGIVIDHIEQKPTEN